MYFNRLGLHCNNCRSENRSYPANTANHNINWSNKMTVHNLTQKSLILTDLVDRHASVCLGLKTLLESGVPAGDLSQVFETLCDQAEEIQHNQRNLITLLKPTASESAA